MSSDRNVRVDYFDAQWYSYQCVWGVTKLNFLLSFLLRVAVREQACKRNLCSPCHKGRDAVLALRRACWQHLLFRLWSLLLIQNSRCYCNRNLIKKVLSYSALSCLSQQHPIRTLLCEVLHSTWHDRVSARKRLPLTNEQLSQTKRIRKIMRRKCDKSSTNSSDSKWVFNGSYFHGFLCYGSVVDSREGRKRFLRSAYIVYEFILYDNSAGPRRGDVA